MYDGRKAVCHDNGRTSLAHFHQRGLDVPLCLCVQSGGRLVKKDNGRGFKDCPRDTNTLFLSSAKLQSSLPHHCGVLIGEREDSLVNVSVTSRLFYLLVTSFGVTWGAGGEWGDVKKFRESRKEATTDIHVYRIIKFQVNQEGDAGAS